MEVERSGVPSKTTQKEHTSNKTSVLYKSSLKKGLRKSKNHSATLPPSIENTRSALISLSKKDYEILRKTDFNWLVPDFLTQGSISCIYAEGGSGKSLFALYLALLICKNKSVTDFFYLDGDNPMQIIQSRNVELIEQKCGGKFHYVTKDSRLFTKKRFNFYTFLDEIVKYYKSSKDPIPLKGVVYVLDTLKSFAPNTDFTKELDATRLMQKLANLRDLGATIIFLHHQTKQIEGENNKTYKGATPFKDMADCMYFLSNRTKNFKTIEKNKHQVLFLLEAMKDRVSVSEKEATFLIDTKSLRIKRVSNFYALTEKEINTVKIAKKIVDEFNGGQGIVQKDLLNLIEKYAYKEGILVYGRVNTWKILHKFDDILFRITEAAGSGRMKFLATKLYTPIAGKKTNFYEDAFLCS